MRVKSGWPSLACPTCFAITRWRLWSWGSMACTECDRIEMSDGSSLSEGTSRLISQSEGSAENGHPVEYVGTISGYQETTPETKVEGLMDALAKSVDRAKEARKNALIAEQEMLVAEAERRANLRLRAEQGDGLCLGEHVIERIDERDRYRYHLRLTCDGKRIDALCVNDEESHLDQDIKTWMELVMARHERQVAAAVVLELLDEIEAP